MIVFMDSDIPSIYFPIGDPGDGGSCAFATEQCMTYCPSGQLRNQYEEKALAFFKENSAKKVADQIKANLGVLADKPYNAKMLQWFPWGDCLPELTEKTAEIILSLHDAGIPQYGFTRNRKLWMLVPNEDRLHLGLTVDDYDEALLLSHVSQKMVAFPSFETGYAHMIFNGKVVSRCSGWWCHTETESRNSDCTRCLACGEGCYFRIPAKRGEE
jgi:hypothetical protein